MKVYEKKNNQTCFILQDESGQVINEFYDHGILPKIADGYGLDRWQFVWLDQDIDLDKWQEIQMVALPISIVK